MISNHKINHNFLKNQYKFENLTNDTILQKSNINLQKTYKCMHILTGHKNIILSFALKNHILFSGSLDGSIRVYYILLYIFLIS